MSPKMKKALTFAAVGVFLFVLITEPQQAAAAVQTVLGWLRQGAESIIIFVRSVF